MKVRRKRTRVDHEIIEYCTGWNHVGRGWYECHGTTSDWWTIQNGVHAAGYETVHFHDPKD